MNYVLYVSVPSLLFHHIFRAKCSKLHIFNSQILSSYFLKHKGENVADVQFIMDITLPVPFSFFLSQLKQNMNLGNIKTILTIFWYNRSHSFVRNSGVRYQIEGQKCGFQLVLELKGHEHLLQKAKNGQCISTNL